MLGLGEFADKLGKVSLVGPGMTLQLGKFQTEIQDLLGDQNSQTAQVLSGILQAQSNKITQGGLATVFNTAVVWDGNPHWIGFRPVSNQCHSRTRICSSFHVAVSH